MMLIILSASFVQAHKAPPPFNGTVTIGKDTTSPGEQISVPVNVTGFNNIGSITLEIRFNPLLMNFTGVSGGYSGLFTPTPYAVDSTIYLIFSATDLVNFQTFSDGLLLKVVGQSKRQFGAVGFGQSQLVRFGRGSRFAGDLEVLKGFSVEQIGLEP